MRAWLDVTAGVAGDMLMGALVDAGADLAGIQQAIRAVAGDGIVLRAEPVTRAGLAATKVHVGINAAGGGARTWAQLREQVDGAALAESTRSRALATLDALATAYSRGHDLSPSALELHEVAALDVLADIVGDCEALRLLGVTEVTASPLAIGSGRIRTSHGDLSVPVPSVAELIDGWRLFDVTGEAAAPVVPRGGAATGCIVSGGRPLARRRTCHQRSSSAAVTPITESAVRITCATALASSTRAAVSGRFSSSSRRKAGSSLPRFHRLWKPPARSAR